MGRLGYILEFPAADDRTSFYSDIHQDWSKPNYDVKVKCDRQTLSKWRLCAVAKTHESNPRWGRINHTVLHTWFMESRKCIYARGRNLEIEATLYRDFNIYVERGAKILVEAWSSHGFRWKLWVVRWTIQCFIVVSPPKFWVSRLIHRKKAIVYESK